MTAGISGSARTLPDDPLYAQARNLAAALAAEGWMVVTGAGPGIMAAGVIMKFVARFVLRAPFFGIARESAD